MEQLFLAMSKILPEEKLLDELSEALTNYKLLPSESAKNKLHMFSMMICTRFATEGKELTDVITDFERKSKTLQLFEEKQ